MGCLTAYSKKVGNGISAELTSERTIEAKASRVGNFFVRFGLICSTNYAKQIGVSKDNLWLIPENMFEDSFAIFTNVEWHIT